MVSRLGWRNFMLLHVCSMLFGPNFQRKCFISAAKFSVEIITPTEARADIIGSSLPLIGPAVDLAVSELTELYGDKMTLRQTYLFDVKAQNCADIVAGADFLVADYYYRRKVVSNATVFIFPGGCTGMSEGIARLSQAWNQLTVIQSYTKNHYPNLIHISPIALPPIFETYAAFMNKYKWQTMYVIGDLGLPSNPVLSVGGAQTLNKELLRRNFTIYLGMVNSSRTDDPFDQALSDIHLNARVISIFAHAIPLRRFMIRAHLKNMTTADYVYIFLDFYEYPISVSGNVTWQNNDADDPMAFEAFRALFVVAPTSSLSAAGRKSREELFLDLNNRSKRDYNFTSTMDSRPSPVIIVPYAAVNILGQILSRFLMNQIVPSSLDVSSGSAWIARQMAGQSFRTRIGDISFDMTGERAVVYDVKQIDDSTGAFEPVYKLNATYTGILDQVGNLVWQPGGPPPNEPPCGYSGFASICSTSSYILKVTAPTVCLVVAAIGGLLVVFRQFQRRLVIKDSFRDYTVASNLLMFTFIPDHSKKSRYLY